MLNNWHKKEKPIQGLMGFGGGATGNLVRGGGGGSFSGTGGSNTADSGGYRYHFFRNGGPTTFTVDPTYAGDAAGLEILVIAGGGGGGNRTGGGGGAGGIAFAENIPVNTIPASVAGTNIDVSVGADNGQTGPGAGNPSAWAPGQPYEVFAYGGGTGGTDGLAAGGGGSGGGSHYDATVGGALQPTQNSGKPWVANYGHPGSNGYDPTPWESGGGGGAGGRGVDSNGPQRGTAGPGQLFPAFPSPIFVPSSDPWYSGLNGRGANQCSYGGGGGGGSHPPFSPPNHPQGALDGGGGAGGPNSGNPGLPAIQGTGGGGGGATSNNGGQGGSGMIVLRYPVV